MATISDKGQITLPVNLRKQLGIKPRDRVQVELSGDAIVIRRAPDFMAFEGFLGKRKSQAEEENAVLEQAARRGGGQQR